jgi:hypothetical protein
MAAARAPTPTVSDAVPDPAAKSAPAPTSAASPTTADPAASAPQTVAVASVTDAGPVPSPAVTPPPTVGDTASPTTAAQTDAAAAAEAGAAAAQASAASPSARFAAPKSTAATSFRGAPTTTRGATASQAGGTAATASDLSQAAPSGERSTLDAAHADSAIDAKAGGATASLDPDASSTLSDAAFPASTILSADAATPAANTPADGSAAKSGAETAANLSAEIVQKLAGQSTRFDVQLNPNGLGRVDVAVQIDAKGALTASLSFEKPEAASLLRAHAGDLQQSLTRAGFDLSNASLSFSTADQNGRGSPQNFFAGGFGGGQNPDQGGQGSSAGRAFNAASLAAAQADTIAVQSQGLSARGVDIRI